MLQIVRRLAASLWRHLEAIMLSRSGDVKEEVPYLIEVPADISM